ncbi:hypothetical protein SDC9_122518 [bioreactor metagenome]|uniref:Uncharacterized protein n=1 Tax=bioreactor metagenome TaxID=1076179 RepID=A0A645CF41_9ZZZZ
MGGHKGSLVDHDDILVFEDNIKLSLHRQNAPGSLLFAQNSRFYHITLFEHMGDPDQGAVYEDFLVVLQSGQGLSRQKKLTC